jgi:hypothetical protein
MLLFFFVCAKKNTGKRKQPVFRRGGFIKLLHYCELCLSNYIVHFTKAATYNLSLTIFSLTTL